MGLLGGDTRNSAVSPLAGSKNGELSAFKPQLNFWDIFFNVFMPNQVLTLLLYSPCSKLLLEKDREPSPLRDPVISVPVLCLPSVVSCFAPEISALAVWRHAAQQQQRFPAELSSNGFLPAGVTVSQ